MDNLKTRPKSGFSIRLGRFWMIYVFVFFFLFWVGIFIFFCLFPGFCTGLMLSAGSLVHFYLLFFIFIRWFTLKNGGFLGRGVLCLWYAVGTLVLEMWAPAPASSGGDDGDLFQGLNDAPPLPAKIKKVAYRAPAAQLKNWQPTDLYHSLAVKMFGFRSQFLKCCAYRGFARKF